MGVYKRTHPFPINDKKANRKNCLSHFSGLHCDLAVFNSYLLSILSSSKKQFLSFSNQVFDGMMELRNFGFLELTFSLVLYSQLNLKRQSIFGQTTTKCVVAFGRQQEKNSSAKRRKKHIIGQSFGSYTLSKVHMYCKITHPVFDYTMKLIHCLEHLKEI